MRLIFGVSFAEDRAAIAYPYTQPDKRRKCRARRMCTPSCYGGLRGAGPSWSAWQRARASAATTKAALASAKLQVAKSSGDSSIGIGVIRRRALKWLFRQEKVTSHYPQNVCWHSETALTRDGLATEPDKKHWRLRPPFSAWKELIPCTLSRTSGINQRPRLQAC
jgi:hypothetical protein